MTEHRSSKNRVANLGGTLTALLLVLTFATNAQAYLLTTNLYSAGADPALDPQLSPGWTEDDTSGGTPHNLGGAGNGLDSATSVGGVNAWQIGDALIGGGQGDSLIYEFTGTQLAQMIDGGFTLEIQAESVGSGGFLSLGYTDIFDGTGFRRVGATPGISPGGVHETFTWTYVPGSEPTSDFGATAGGSNLFFSGPSGGAELHFADNTSGSSAMDFRIVSVTLTTNAIPEPSTILLLGAGAIGLVMRRKSRQRVALFLALALALPMFNSTANAITLDHIDLPGLVTGGSQATFEFQTFTPSVGGLGTGDDIAANSPLPALLTLQDVSFVRGPTGTATAGNLFIDLYAGGTGDTGTFLGSSLNSIDVNAQAGLTQMTWNFDNIEINSADTYSLVVSTTSGAGGTALGRFTAANNGGGFVDTYLGGIADGGSGAVAFDTRFAANFGVAVPEPSTAILLGMGLIGLAARRRRTSNLIANAVVITTIVSLGAFHSANAIVIQSYDSGVTATAGAAGANDPATAAGGSWTGTGNAGGFRAAVDSGNGGWRITDGSGSGAVPQYDYTLTASDQSFMQSPNGWTLNFTVSMPGDAIGDGASVDDYYFADPTGRQTNNLILVEETTSGNRFDVAFTASAGGNMVVNGTTLTGPVGMNDEIPGAVSVNFVDFSLAYPGSGTTALLTASTGDSFLVSATAATSDRIYWGAGSASGQGSTIWNNISLSVVPEPSTAILLGMGIVGLAARRRARSRK